MDREETRNFFHWLSDLIEACGNWVGQNLSDLSVAADVITIGNFFGALVFSGFAGLLWIRDKRSKRQIAELQTQLAEAKKKTASEGKLKRELAKAVEDLTEELAEERWERNLAESERDELRGYKDCNDQWLQRDLIPGLEELITSGDRTRVTAFAEALQQHPSNQRMLFGAEAQRAAMADQISKEADNDDA